MKLRDYTLESLAAMVVGDHRHFPYRSSSFITRFFQRCDLNYAHDGLLQAFNGNLYGTTREGGVTFYGGTIFQISLGGDFHTVYRFCSQSGCADGAGPVAGLIQGTNGTLYGTTEVGGPYGTPNGGGTVFEIAPNGALRTLYGFCFTGPDCTDGKYPGAALIQASDGNLYGTTLYGGANRQGTVFKLELSGALTVLHSFCAQPAQCPDGSVPSGSVMQASDGNLYGMTQGGGSNNCPGGCGTVFQITPSGAFSTIYTFCAAIACGDGSKPVGALVQGTDGELYGTNSNGGNYDPLCGYSLGTIFKLTTAGALTTIYSFPATGSSCGTNGAAPLTGLTLGSDGDFYGTTLDGGTSCGTGCGTLFKVTSTGVFTSLYSFCQGCAAGTSPDAALVQDTEGDFFGTSNGGGAGGAGAVFRLSVGLGRFVKAYPDSGNTGAAIELLGNGLTGATAISFNGAPAPFKVVTSTLILARVPAGATSGQIQVTTPSGTLASNVSFRVLP